MLTKVIERLSYGGCVLSQASVFVLMLLGIVVVVLRKFTTIPFLGGINLCTFFLVGLVYLAMAQVQREKGHVVVDIAIALLHDGGLKTVLAVFQLIFSLIITVIIAWASWVFALESLEYRERIDGAPFYPLYPIKIVVAIGISLLLLQLFADVVKAFRAFGKRADQNAKEQLVDN